MTDKLAETYKTILEQLREAEEKVKALNHTRAYFEQAGAHLNGSPTPTPSVHPSPVANGLKTDSRGTGRAPNGHLEAQILALLKGGDHLTNAEMRSRLISQGYGYSLEPVHVSKTLTKLFRFRRIKSEGPPNNRKYRLP